MKIKARPVRGAWRQSLRRRWRRCRWPRLCTFSGRTATAARVVAPRARPRSAPHTTFEVARGHRNRRHQRQILVRGTTMRIIDQLSRGRWMWLVTGGAVAAATAFAGCSGGFDSCSADKNCGPYDGGASGTAGTAGSGGHGGSGGSAGRGGRPADRAAREAARAVWRAKPELLVPRVRESCRATRLKHRLKKLVWSGGRLCGFCRAERKRHYRGYDGAPFAALTNAITMARWNEVRHRVRCDLRRARRGERRRSRVRRVLVRGWEVGDGSRRSVVQAERRRSCVED